jgi:20S proteasome subunit beta 3
MQLGMWAHMLYTILVAQFIAVFANVHGGTFLAMAGKDAVVLLADSRFSSQKTGTMLLGKYPRKTIRVGCRCLIGCFGLESDSWALLSKLRSKFVDISEDDTPPASVARVVSDMLYNNNLVLSPIVVGIEREGSAYICTMDGLGAQTVSDKFSVAGTASEGLLALCESLYRPNLEASALAELAERCFHLAMQRDVMSGCNYRVHTLKADNIYVKDVERLDV